MQMPSATRTVDGRSGSCRDGYQIKCGKSRKWRRGGKLGEKRYYAGEGTDEDK